MIDKLNNIRELNFFHSLDEKQVGIVANISNIINYSKNSILYYENDTHNKLFFLVSGLLKVYKITNIKMKYFYTIYIKIH